MGESRDDFNLVHERVHGALEADERAARFSWRRVLGVRLAPLTLWHCRALHAAKHPQVYAAEEGALDPHSVETLMVGIEICALDPVRWMDAKGRVPTLGGLIGARMGLAGLFTPFMVRRAARRYLESPEQGKEDWDDYLSEGFSIPIVGKTKGANEVACPWFLSLVVELRSRLGMSEVEAWSVNPGRAIWLIQAAREIELGESKMLPESEMALRKEAGWDVSGGGA